MQKGERATEFIRSDDLRRGGLGRAAESIAEWEEARGGGLVGVQQSRRDFCVSDSVSDSVERIPGLRDLP